MNSTAFPSLSPRLRKNGTVPRSFLRNCRHHPGIAFFAALLQVALQILPGETFKTAICDIRSLPVARVLF